MPSESITDRFSARTRHHADFTISALIDAKRRRGLTISVVIPARDEAPTVGLVAGTLRRTLIEETALLDEIVVIDADSSDRTGDVARAAGARVVRQSDIMPEAGTSLGKGEALWKGLAASSGDLVVFIDADILDIGSRFVVGLLGPLLTEEGVRFTKATYDRPLQLANELRPSGGGRVTELLARPIIASFWPELAWLAQPLSGEYAGDRDLLERLPFVQGYGVELGMLVDILDRFGPDSITQVDLGTRIHDHQELDALGRMATEILHVAIDRLASQGRLVLTDPLATLLLQPTRDDDGVLTMAAHDVVVGERPPLRTWRAEH